MTGFVDPGSPRQAELMLKRTLRSSGRGGASRQQSAHANELDTAFTSGPGPALLSLPAASTSGSDAMFRAVLTESLLAAPFEAVY